MLTPLEEARLRDDLCVRLLEATSSLEALARVRRALRERAPAYDVAPDPWLTRAGRIQPRDVLLTCGHPACAQRFWTGSSNARYCSDLCRGRDRDRRVRLAVPA